MIVAVLVGWEAITEQASLYYRLLLILETGMLGVFHRPGYHSFLCIFRVHANSTVFHNRHLGPPATKICRNQVLHLYIGRERADVFGAAGDRALGLLSSHRRSGDLENDFFNSRIDQPFGDASDGSGRANVDIYGTVCRICRQSAAGSIAYVVAAGARRGAYGRQRDPGGRAAKDRRLRVRPIQPADAALCLGLFHALCALVGACGSHLRLAGRIGSKRYQAVDRLLQRRAHGILYDRSVRAQILWASKAEHCK